VKLKSIALATLATLSLFLSSACSVKADEPCRAYYSDRDGIDDEVNNCPINKDNFLLRGTFSNTKWQISFWQYEPAYYILNVTNKQDGSNINLAGLNVAGTTTRPQYKFFDETTKMTYVVTFRYTDSNTIRLEIYQNDRASVNELLPRESDKVIGGP
jgi:hypothetical protein